MTMPNVSLYAISFFIGCTNKDELRIEHIRQFINEFVTY